MRTLLIASALVATTFAASAMEYGIKYGPNTQAQAAAPTGLTRAQVVAEYTAAKAAGQVNITEFEMRQAERDNLQATSSLTRQAVMQEAAAHNAFGYLGLHGDK